MEPFSGAPIRRLGGSGARDEPAQIDFVDGFEVFKVCADIADMREGKNDDLPGIGGIGEDFLIAGDGGIEAQFADIASLSAEALAEKGRPVLKDERAPVFLFVFMSALYTLCNRRCCSYLGFSKGEKMTSHDLICH